MIVRQSIRNLIRSGKKTILFFMLLLLLTLLSCIGLSVTVLIGDFIKQCNESYTTVGVFEYIGTSYPDESEYDSNIGDRKEELDALNLKGYSGVEQWDNSQKAMGKVEGIQRLDSLVPYKDNAVLIVHISDSLNDLYRATIIDELYTQRSKNGSMVYLNTYGIKLQKDHYYIVHGAYYIGDTSYTYFKVASFENMSAKKDGLNGRIEQMIVDITEESGGYVVDDSSIFYDIANTYQVANNSVTINATLDLEGLLSFQQGVLYLVEGRGFTKEEYEKGEKVCVISEDIAKDLGLTVGDKVTLAMIEAKECSLSESYWANTGYTYNEEFTVIGVVNKTNEWMYQVFVPQSKAWDLSKNNVTYTLGQVRLNNDMASFFYEEVSSRLPEGVRVTIYDQGYASVAGPLKDIYQIVLILSVICMITGVSLILLFGFLFVYRQREVAQIMFRLGTGKKKIYQYYLVGAGLLTILGTLVGAFISYLLSGKLIMAVDYIVKNYVTKDLRFSNGNLSMLKEIELVPSVKLSFYLIVAFVIVVLSLLSCMYFIQAVMKTTKRRTKTFKRKAKKSSSSLKGGAVKYAFLSILRGNMRSLIPVVVSLTAVILLCQLSGTKAVYQEKQEEFYQTSQLQGYFTNIKGQSMSGLVVSGMDVREIYQSGLVSQVSVSKGFHYVYLGRSMVDGVPLEVPPFQLPQTPFGLETFYYKASKGPSFVCTNDLSSVPEFYFSSHIQTEFLAGYDASSLGKEMDGNAYCMVSTSFMVENGVKLGDTIRLALVEENMGEVDLLVIGSFVKQGEKDNIYCQLGAMVSPNYLFEADNELDGMVSNWIYHMSFESAVFQLTEGKNLSTFKDYLKEKGYSEVNQAGQKRSFIVLEDKSFLNTENALAQKLWYMNYIFPCLYVLIEVLAVYISFLLIQVRKKEIAIMRGMGASKKVTFFSVFTEQMVLCIGGALIGIGLWMVTNTLHSSLGIWLSIVFVFGYLMGTTLSIWHINRCSVMGMLRAEE